MREHSHRPVRGVWILAAMAVMFSSARASAQSPGPPPADAVHVAVSQGSAAADATAAAAGLANERVASATALLASAAEAPGRAEDRQRAGERERLAVERLAQARDLEERERNEMLRELRAREREIAEAALAQTRDHSDRLAAIYRETRTHLAQLTQRKATLLDALDAVPVEANEEARRAEVDPLFDDLLALRIEAHEGFRGALDAGAAARRTLTERGQQVDAARTRLARARERKDQLDASQLWERRVAVAEAELDLAEQRALHQREIVDAYRERSRDYHTQFGFFASTIQPLLERISDKRHGEFFDLGDSGNWEMAISGVETGVRALRARVEVRLDQIEESGLATLELWAWVWRLIWGLAGLLLVAFVAIGALIWLVDRLCAALLRRRLLRRNATLLVKVAEILRAISRPTLYYVGVAFVAKRAAESIPELLGVVWIADAVFMYWVVMQASRVLLLPRSHRRLGGESSAEELGYLDEASADRAADIVGVDLARAQKLLNSIRVVTVFWLFAAYLPGFLRPLTGITVLWWLVDRAATWGFVAVVYWVLSRWRHEIAELFEKVAGARLAPAVAFVQRHKTRPWGVLVIAVTSIFVVVHEIAGVVRRYVLETNVFKQLSALAFRTQIEMQNRARTEDASAAVPAGELDPDYLEFFVDRPLDDEEWAVQIDRHTARLEGRLSAWLGERRRGSIAVSGEAGIGKTTLLNQFARHCRDEGLHVVEGRFVDRVTTRGELLALLAGVFDIEETPLETAELVRVIRELESRVVIIDDSHLCFSRHIDRLDVIEALLDVVHLCDGRHFFVLSFARHAWRYIDRVEARGRLFGEVVEMEAWPRDALQQLVERRNEASGYTASFANLVAAYADNGGAQEFDVIETARGYFGYLHEFSGGNPRVAMLYWLESVQPSPRVGVLDVDLFERPNTEIYASFTDDHWFVLAALAQHGGLEADELSDIVDCGAGFCVRALDYFGEHDVVEIDPGTGRATVSARHWRSVLRRLAASKFLFGA